MATHIKSILVQFLKHKKRETADITRIEEIVNTGLGEKVGKYIHLKKVYKKKLFFNADTSGAIYEFGLKKAGLLEAVRKEFPEIEGVRIKIG
jgi:hypothetical protein